MVRVARAVTPILKSGAKALENIALRSGADFVGVVLGGKNVREAPKTRAMEAANVVKKGINKQINQSKVAPISASCGSTVQIIASS